MSWVSLGSRVHSCSRSTGALCIQRVMGLPRMCGTCAAVVIGKRRMCLVTHRSLWPGWMESLYLWVCICGSRSLFREGVGSLFSAEASLGSAGAGILFTAVLSFYASIGRPRVLTERAGVSCLIMPGLSTPKNATESNLHSLTHMHIVHYTHPHTLLSLPHCLHNCHPAGHHLAQSHITFCFSASSPTKSLIGTISRLWPSL